MQSLIENLAPNSRHGACVNDGWSKHTRTPATANALGALALQLQTPFPNTRNPKGRRPSTHATLAF
eukprot:3970820-Alexandrium_andersonii.AAC.1